MRKLALILAPQITEQVGLMRSIVLRPPAAEELSTSIIFFLSGTVGAWSRP